MPRLPTLALALALAAVPASASAQPQPGRMSLRVAGGLPTSSVRYVAPRQRVVAVGTVRPYVAGQSATLELRRRGKVVRRYRVPIAPARNGRGRFVVRFAARRRGTLRLIARHEPTGEQAAFRSRSRLVRAVVWRAGAGASGLRVLLLQRGLRALRFATPVTGRFDGGTSRAVLAYRKTGGMGWSGYASSGVYRRLMGGRGRFRLRHPRAGKHVEFDWSRQLLVLGDRGRAYRVYHASSGKASTPTVFGSFRFYLKQPGFNSRRMLHSNYFIGGYAIHGYASVPTYPASHGCIRVPIPNADEIDRWIRRRDRIFVYR